MPEPKRNICKNKGGEQGEQCKNGLFSQWINRESAPRSSQVQQVLF